MQAQQRKALCSGDKTSVLATQPTDLTQQTQIKQILDGMAVKKSTFGKDNCEDRCVACRSRVILWQHMSLKSLRSTEAALMQASQYSGRPSHSARPARWVAALVELQTAPERVPGPGGT